MPFDQHAHVRDRHVKHLRELAKSAPGVLSAAELNLDSALAAEVRADVRNWTTDQLWESVAGHECDHIQKTARNNLANEGRRWLRDFCAGVLPFEVDGHLMVPDTFIRAPDGYMSLHRIGPHVFDNFLAEVEKAEQDCADLLKTLRPLPNIVRDAMKPGVTFDQVATDIYNKVKLGPHA